MDMMSKISKKFTITSPVICAGSGIATVTYLKKHINAIITIEILLLIKKGVYNGV